jgi:aminopeptidase N
MLRTEEAKPFRLQDYRPTPYAAERVHLDLALDPDATIVTSEIEYALKAGAPAGAALELVGDELVLLSVAIDGVELLTDAYVSSPSHLTVHRPPTGLFRLTVKTKIAPAANTKLMGIYRTRGTYCSQCEAEGFRRITYCYDRPDSLAVYTTRIEADRAANPYLLSNGNLVESGEIVGTGRHYAVWVDPHPKPSYLFAMVAGDLAKVSDTFVTQSGRTVALEIFVEHGKEDRVDYAMDALKRSMTWDEQAFGREYDLDVFMIVAVSDFNMGAMENKGLNVFNDKYVLAKPETATDTDYAGIESVIAHEYFHNWTGNRITCRDWFQLCLKEGLTVFRDQEFTSDVRSRPVKRISDVRLLKAHQFPEDAGPLAHPVRPEIYHEINNFYTATVYEKGAEVVRMVKTMLGADTFRKGMDLYFERHDGEAATVEDFITCFADASGRDFGPFMAWYRQAGTPEVAVSGSYDEDGGRYTLYIRQSLAATPGQPVKGPMVIPIRYGLVDPDGQDMTPTRVTGAEVMGDVIVLTQVSHEVTFEGLTARPVPSLLRGFSAPVRLSVEIPEADRYFLAARDNDPFNRWQALQGLFIEALINGTQAARKGRAVDVDERLIEAVGRLLADETLDPAFRALLLALPSEADVARDIGKDVDPDAIQIARHAMRRQIGEALMPALKAAYAANATPGAYSPDAGSAGKRALKNTVLDYIVHAGGAQGVALAKAQYDGADNMTDRVAAMTVLCAADGPASKAALADYYERFAGDGLAIDKWLSVQAMTAGADAIERMKALREHPGFSISNPNRVRSLYGAFATGNQTQFNRLDGAGYNLIADLVLELDGRNPQVAARILSAFRSWRALEERRRRQAEAALRRIGGTPDLSPDVADIANRCLA